MEHIFNFAINIEDEKIASFECWNGGLTMVLKDVRPIIAELVQLKKSIPLEIDVGRYFPEIRKNTHGEAVRAGIKKALRAIEQAPKIDAVEVVRCRECKHWGTAAAGETDHVKQCEYGSYMVGESGYCVYGEMKKDEK